MKKSIVLAATAVLLFSCKKENTDTAVTTTPTEETVITDNSETVENTNDDVIANGNYCYLHALNNDSIKVKVNLDGDKISGDLDRIPFQKDRAKGTFTGTKRTDGKFDVDFNYMQEGMDQNAKLVFDIDDDELEISNDPVYNADLKAVPCK